MPVATDLGALERRILGELLSEAATEYQSHTSNDYELPANDANRALLARVFAQDGARADKPRSESASESNERLFVFDFLLMRYLGERCASGEALERAELSALADLLGTLAEDEFGLYPAGTPEGGYPLPKGKENLAFAKRVVAKAGGELEREDDGTIVVPIVALFAFLAQRCGKAAAKGGSAPVPRLTPAVASGPRRPGISPKWQKQLKTNLANAAKWMGMYEESTRNSLASYAKGARIYLQDGMFGKLQQARWEATLVKQREVDWVAAANAFEAHWLEEHRSLRMLHERSQAGPIGQSMWSPHMICYAAFGLVATTHADAARQLARLQIEGVRRKLNSKHSSNGPSTRFMFHLLADHLGVPRVELRGDNEELRSDEVACDSYLDQLLAVWRDPDPGRVAAPLVAACDAHTHHAFNNADNYRREFTSLSFIRTPIAALLVLRLREELRLANPEVDHPMMEDMRPLLVAKRQPAEPGAELRALRAKLEADGLDFRAIRVDLGAEA